LRCRPSLSRERTRWDQAWGDDAFLVALTYGLARLEAERESSQKPPPGTEPPPGSPADIAALRYRVFELAEAIKILEIREPAFRIDNHGMRLRLAQLEKEAAELEEEVVAAGLEMNQGDGPPPARTNLIGRLFRRREKG
jgi:hypothetical protein